MSDVAARRGKKDAYANVAFGTVTQAAINTIAFAAISMAVGLFQGVAMLLHRVLWYPYAGTLGEIVAGTDRLYLALTSSNRLAGISDTTDPAILCMHQTIGIGVAVANEKLPYESDFTKLPGGGKLIAANPIYLAINTAGFAGVASVRAQLDFTFIELNDRDYLELIQAQFPANIV